MSNEPAVFPIADQPASASTASASWRAVTAEVLKAIPVIGPPLAKAVEAGSWGALLVLLWLTWTFFIYPLLLPFVASQWINAGVLMGERTNYVGPVRKAFGAQEFADDVARESNRRLDYVQAIEYEADASLDKTALLSVAQNQRVDYRIEQATLSTEDKIRCAVPPELKGPDAKLFTLQVEEVPVAEIRNGPLDKRSLTVAQWKAIIDHGGAADHLLVTVQPVAALAALRCGKVKVQMRMLFEVYKDLVEDKRKQDVKEPV